MTWPEIENSALWREREKLVRFCACYTCDADAAEDLAQQTLLEAWRRQDQLRDPAAREPWLLAIARNACLMWGRRRGREMAPWADGDTADLLSDPASDAEWGEVADLLDRAMRHLPAETRRVLTERYLEDRSQAMIAAGMGVSEGAVEARLTRGRDALRRLLRTEFRAEAEHLGLAVPAGSGWQETRICCPFCGRNRLQAHLDRESLELHFRCAGTCTPTGTIVSGMMGERAAALTSPKSILMGTLQTCHEHYDRALAHGWRSCAGCGRTLPVERVTLGEWKGGGIETLCVSCGAGDSASFWHLALDTPEARAFWRRHPRIRALAPWESEEGGRRVIVAGFESMKARESIRIAFDRDSYRIVPGAGAP